MSKDYQTIIGLEIHVELATRSKMFCRCQNPTTADFAESRDNPNTFVCPICLGHPGTLPVPNLEAIKKTIKVGLALNSQVAELTKFDRKHYFYPDLPKGYQISQYDQPLVRGGFLEVSRRDGTSFKVNLTRIHIEEDAGKLLHPEGSASSLVDLNRAGVPLIEIVTEPDLTSPEDAKLFLQELRLLMRYLGVSNADMEKGQLRCDANINIKIKSERNGQPNPQAGNDDEEAITTPVTEIKNLNSFRMVERALEAEAERQYQEWRSGGLICQRKNKITVGWNDAKREIIIQREKEEANDYRYFPEPDIPPMVIVTDGQKPTTSVRLNGAGGETVEVSRADLPELPCERRERYQALSLSPADVDTLVNDPERATYFDQTIREGDSFELIKKLASIIINELREMRVNGDHLRQLGELLVAGQLSSQKAKEVLRLMQEEDRPPAEIIDQRGWGAVPDSQVIESIVSEVIAKNPKVVADYQSGKVAAIGVLIGQVLKLSAGSADPKLVKEIIENKLS